MHASASCVNANRSALNADIPNEPQMSRVFLQAEKERLYVQDLDNLAAIQLGMRLRSYVAAGNAAKLANINLHHHVVRYVGLG